eukprot:1842450-Pleurochrysis_carterae.AAC.2
MCIRDRVGRRERSTEEARPRDRSRAKRGAGRLGRVVDRSDGCTASRRTRRGTRVVCACPDECWYAVWNWM